MAHADPPLISARDMLQLAALAMMAPVSLLAPLHRWPKSCESIACLSARFSIQQVSEFAEKLAAIERDNNPKADTTDSYARCLEMYWETRLHIADQSLARRWQPAVGLSGGDHLDAALNAGRGAILWVSPFAYSDLIAKIGLAQAGYNIAHLSRPEHGFSETRFGMATLNRMRVRIEDRYLDQRVRIDKNQEQRATLQLRRILKKNGVASITVGSQTRQPARVALGPGELAIATGAIRLAKLTGAPLIPAFAVKQAAANFHIYLEAPIDVSHDDDSGALQQYAQCLRQYLVNYPYQWRGVADYTLTKATA